MAAKQAIQSYYSPLKLIDSTATRRSRPTSISPLSCCSESRPLMLFGPAPTKWAVVKCSGETPQETGGGYNLKDALTGMVGKEVEELLAKEENKALLDKLEKASERVEIARRELLEIERQEAEAKQLREYVNQLEARASEIEECQQEISAARAMVEEAEKSLSVGSENEATEEDLERVESIKAAGVSALVGTLAAVPVSLAGLTSYDQLLLPVAVTFISCALFGVTFRYAVRRDLDNFQLKTGTYAAFGFVKGLGMLVGGAPLELNTESILSHTVDGALCVSQSVLVFAFSAISLDYCFKVGIVSPFPVKGSSSQTNEEY